jgi:hypothetical protein
MLAPAQAYTAEHLGFDRTTTDRKERTVSMTTEYEFKRRFVLLKTEVNLDYPGCGR